LAFVTCFAVDAPFASAVLTEEKNFIILVQAKSVFTTCINLVFACFI